MEEGKITISRCDSNVEESYIEITVSDSNYKKNIVCKVSLENFAKAITGFAYQPVQIERVPR